MNDCVLPGLKTGLKDCASCISGFQKKNQKLYHEATIAAITGFKNGLSERQEQMDILKETCTQVFAAAKGAMSLKTNNKTEEN